MRNRNKFSVILIISLLTALSLQGCLFPPTTIDAPVETTVPAVEEEVPPIPPSTTYPPTRGRFTLRYDSSSELNPITSRSSDNILLSSLIYESLFVLDSDLNVTPVLCESWSREDDYTYIFEIRPGIAMSDGSMLDAEDVVYTLKQAMQTGRFVNRLRIIDSVTADGDMTVRVVLNISNSRFINLLDVPVIKNGSIDSSIPPGTGPYTFSNTPSIRLNGFTLYRGFAQLPVLTIYLIECDNNEMAELFDDGVISLLWDDPSDSFDIRLNRLHEKLYYETTALQFIGFNMRSIALRDQDVRRAIGCAIDRQYITENIMPRQALAAPLALSPAYRLYDVTWEIKLLDPLKEMAYHLNFAGLEDFNDDSFLEYPDRSGGYYSFSIDFIVNSENMHKIQVAELIAETLRRTGFDITVRELPPERFMEALQSGDFDMYYGEIILSADFNMSPLLLPGSLNYGNTGSYEYEQYVTDFLFARTDVGERAAAKQLCDEITRNAPFVPILYKKYVMYTPMGAITGASPSQSGVFCNITDWTIDFTMLS